MSRRPDRCCSRPASPPWSSPPSAPTGSICAAIVAAICTGQDAHPDPQRRWIVGVLYGGLYLVVALFAAPLAGLFIAMPPGRPSPS